MTEPEGPPFEEGIPDDLELLPEGADIPPTDPVPEPDEDDGED